MQTLNFLSTLTPRQHAQVRRWYYVSLILASIALTTMSIMQIRAWHSLRTARAHAQKLEQKAAHFDATLTQHHALKERYRTLQKRMQKIHSTEQSGTTTYEVLATIMSLCGTTLHITSLTLEDKKLELTLNCPSAEHATALCQRALESPHIQSLRIMSLQSQGDGMITTLRGALT